MSYFTENETKVIALGLTVLLVGAVLRLAWLHWPLMQQVKAPIISHTTSKPIKLIAINQADFNQLHSLNGIGKTLANRIIDYRNKHGKFTSREQLLRVKGLTKKVLRQIYFKISL